MQPRNFVLHLLCSSITLFGAEAKVVRFEGGNGSVVCTQEPAPGVKKLLLSSCRGIPFSTARPFMKPELVPLFPDVKDGSAVSFERDATKPGPIFPESLDLGSDPNASAFLSKIMQSESTEIDPETAYLDIFIPETKGDRLLPVVIDFHGGAFWFGSHNSAIHDMRKLYQRMDPSDNKVIFVSPNYRKGHYGFSYVKIEDQVHSNAALWDAVLALKWVQDNVQHFGGDPHNVTISGQSAGAAIVHYLLLILKDYEQFGFKYPPLKRALLMSGTRELFKLQTADEAKATFDRLLEATGCVQDDSMAALECMQNLDPQSFTPLSRAVSGYVTPVFDGVLFKSQDPEVQAADDKGSPYVDGLESVMVSVLEREASSLAIEHIEQLDELGNRVWNLMGFTDFAECLRAQKEEKRKCRADSTSSGQGGIFTEPSNPFQKTISYTLKAPLQGTELAARKTMKTTHRGKPGFREFVKSATSIAFVVPANRLVENLRKYGVKAFLFYNTAAPELLFAPSWAQSLTIGLVNKSCPGALDAAAMTGMGHSSDLLCMFNPPMMPGTLASMWDFASMLSSDQWKKYFGPIFTFMSKGTLPDKPPRKAPTHYDVHTAVDPSAVTRLVYSGNFREKLARLIETKRASASAPNLLGSTTNGEGAASRSCNSSQTDGEAADPASSPEDKDGMSSDLSSSSSESFESAVDQCQTSDPWEGPIRAAPTKRPREPEKAINPKRQCTQTGDS